MSLCAIGVVGLAACTDTQMAHLNSFEPARVTCYSGGYLVVDDFSTGKVANAQNSDGYEFKSQTTGRLQQVSGDCQIDYGAVKLAGWQATLPGLRADPSVVAAPPAPASIIAPPSEDYSGK